MMSGSSLLSSAVSNSGLTLPNIWIALAKEPDTDSNVLGVHPRLFLPKPLGMISTFACSSGLTNWPGECLALARIGFKEQQAGHGRALIELLLESTPKLGFICRAACIFLGAFIVGRRIPCLSRLASCLRMEVGLSRRDAPYVTGMFGQGLCGSERCCPRMHGARVSQLQRNAMSCCRLARPGLFTRLLSYRYVLWAMLPLWFTSILCGSRSAVRSIFSRALLRT